MSKPTTITGTGLAAFLRGLLPETNQFDKQIADIEKDAAEAERGRLLLLGPPTVPMSTDEVNAALRRIEGDIAAAERVRLRRIISGYYRARSRLGPPTAVMNLLLDDEADRQEWKEDDRG